MANRFGVLLRDARRRAGMTQEDLAHRSGIGVRTIRRLETGSGNDPRIGTVTMLADALDVAADERRNLLAAADGNPREAGTGPADTDETADPADVEAFSALPPAPALPAVPAEVSDAADNLARVISARLDREEEVRRVRVPFPLPVRWRQAPERLVDHWDNICRVPAGVTAAPLDLAGGVDDIATVYRRVPSRRLVVLGRAGAGKTVLALRFVLDMLAARTPGGAVPVAFNIGSWDPSTTPLRTWLVDTLQRDQPGLAAAAPGGATLAAVLVDTGRILPVLDGFDELAAGLHRPALETLNALTMPMLLTSRFGEYEQAVTAVDVLTSAAVVELTDLTPGDLAGYLPRTSRRITSDDGRATAWDTVIGELTDGGGAAHLAEVLRTPLMVSLARTVYSDSRDRDPNELLDPERFPTPRAIEDHLLDNFVPTVYGDGPAVDDPERRDWDVERVRRWLGFLASDLDSRHTGDLEWWRLGGSLRRRWRVLLVMAVAGIGTALVVWFLFTPLNAIVFVKPVSFAAALLDGLIMPPVIAVPFGLLYFFLVVRGNRILEPARARVGLHDRSSRPPGFRRKVARRFAAGALGGAVAGVAYAGGVHTVEWLFPVPYRGLESEAPLLALIVVDSLFFTMVFGVGAGIVLALAFALEAPANLTTATSPAELLAANRTTVLRLAGALTLTLAIAIAFGGFLAVGALEGLLGPLHWTLPVGLLLGSMGGLCAGFGYVVTFTAWGHWLVFARLRLPLRGKLPWAVVAFLDDAYRRGVLRQSGAVYQFRHARLQEHLARAYRTGAASEN